MNLTLAKSTTANSGSNHDNALLCLVTKAAYSIGTVGLSILQLTGPRRHWTIRAWHDEIESLLGCSMLHEHAGKVPPLHHYSLEHFADLPPLFEERRSLPAFRRIDSCASSLSDIYVPSNHRRSGCHQGPEKWSRYQVGFGRQKVFRDNQLCEERNIKVTEESTDLWRMSANGQQKVLALVEREPSGTLEEVFEEKGNLAFRWSEYAPNLGFGVKLLR